MKKRLLHYPIELDDYILTAVKLGKAKSATEYIVDAIRQRQQTEIYNELENGQINAGG